ncbi:MAG: 3-isopropylmalate dehydratase [Anaerolineae bacterium]|jgi:3-isopropylmalate/(R)-2-methylmalate dehydratase small subunit|nr:3-isopropylmalate dehydratase [Anaerolineae bacterium]
MLTTHRVHVYGDSVNTDVIFPGKYTYTLRTPAEIAAHALEDLDPEFVRRVQPGDVIVAGRNWGMGSSREQAVTTLKYCGVTTLIAASFGGIFFRNCINQGVHPIVCAGLAERLATGDSIGLDVAAGEIHAAGAIFRIPPLSPSVQAILDAGGLVPMLRGRFTG